MTRQKDGKDCVSVIVTVYNLEKHLPRMLQCIKDQTYSNIEIILVDDGSTDSSGRLCDEFARNDSHCLVIHKENGGQSSARNAGQEVAGGDYLVFPDGDDVMHPDTVKTLVDAISSDPANEIAICGLSVVDDSERVVFPQIDVRNRTRLLSRDDLMEGLFSKEKLLYSIGWNKLYRKELLKDLYANDYARHQDFDFNLRVYQRASQAILVDLPLYYWMQHPASKIHAKNHLGIYYDCRCHSLYSNWCKMAESQSTYGHLLLRSLYKDMVFWKEWSRNEPDYDRVKALCDDYQKETVWHYVKCPKVSLGEKMLFLTMLRISSLSHAIMSVTRNAR